MRVNFRIDTPQLALQARINYVLDFIKTHPCAPIEDFEFAINGHEADNYDTQVRYSSSAQPTEYEYVIPAETALLGIHPGQRLPLVMQGYTTDDGTKIYSAEKNKTQYTSQFITNKTFAFDWIATIFFHLSRIEEYQLTAEHTDNIGVMHSNEMLICKHNLHHQAVIDRLVEAIFRAFRLKPRQVPTKVRLTHDLDSLKLFGSPFTLIRYMGGVATRTHTRHFFGRMALDYLRTITKIQPDPADTFDYMLRANNQGVLYFGYGRHTEKDIFPDYTHPRMAQVLSKAKELGYELGFHPGYGTWQDPTQWQKERSALQQWLGQKVVHTRQHFLRFSFPHTCDILEQEGIQSDSTLGFRDRLGFRCGTGVPFYLYNFKKERAYTWQEIPPILMDIALLREVAYSGETMLKMYRNFLQTNPYNGIITTIFHNTIFYEPDLAHIPLRQLYDSLI